MTDTFELGVQSLAAHAAYLKGLGDHMMANPREVLEMVLRPAGTRLGCTYAATFEVISL